MARGAVEKRGRGLPFGQGIKTKDDYNKYASKAYLARNFDKKRGVGEASHLIDELRGDPFALYLPLSTAHPSIDKLSFNRYALTVINI